MKKQITKFGWLIIAVTMMAFAPKEAEAQTVADYPSGEIKEPENGTGTADDPYQIANAGNLYWFANYVNDGHDAACAKLTADIEVNSSLLTDKIDENGNVKEDVTVYKWILIGYDNDSDYEDFTGTFDGDNHTISGLYFCDDSKMRVGLIGTASGATIKNVRVEDSYFKGDVNVGGVCGSNSGGTILNCSNTGTVNGKGGNVGGVCGVNSMNGTIENCYNTGTVSGENQVGGVCGSNIGTISNCNNTGKVSGTEDIGGVCGVNNVDCKIENCNNTGQVSGTKNFGGVCGKNNVTSTIQYKRTGLTAGNYGTICMPYGVKTGDRSGAKFYSIAGKTTDNGKVTAIYLEEVTGDLVAGQPYIFRATAEEMICTCSTDNEQDAQTENELVGTYTVLDVPEGENNYILKDNKIYKRGSQNWKIAANRAYINMDKVGDYNPSSSAPARTIKIGVSDDGTTGIGGVTVENGGEYYNLQGQRVATPSRGIYIVNGKKIVIK